MTDSGLSRADIEKILSVFVAHKEIEEAILFGSRAIGNYKPASDIDLALKGTELNLTVQQQIENELDDLFLPYKFDIALFDKISDQDLIDHINEIGIVFYDQRLFLHPPD
jgi:predicted nucleotidyltransferase